MSDTAGGRLVGVVGDVPDGLSTAVTEAGGTIASGDADAVLDADPDALVAGGQSALAALVDAGATVPILPVGSDRGFRPVEADTATAARRLVTGEFERESHTAVSVAVDGERVGQALADVTLVTATAARISEFTVTAGEPVARFRADGVVVATAGGSTEYARAAGGPVVTPGRGVVSVVPIAPFATSLDHWVLPTDAVELVVERDEATVTLLADGSEVATLSRGDTVTLSPAAEFTVAVVPESRSRFDERKLERH
ncbi:MAG: ATP-NAD kinase [Haloarculaceae archaeon]